MGIGDYVVGAVRRFFPASFETAVKASKDYADLARKADDLTETGRVFSEKNEGLTAKVKELNRDYEKANQDAKELSQRAESLQIAVEDYEEKMHRKGLIISQLTQEADLARKTRQRDIMDSVIYHKQIEGLDGKINGLLGEVRRYQGRVRELEQRTDDLVKGENERDRLIRELRKENSSFRSNNYAVVSILEPIMGQMSPFVILNSKGKRVYTSREAEEYAETIPGLIEGGGITLGEPSEKKINLAGEAYHIFNIPVEDTNLSAVVILHYQKYHKVIENARTSLKIWKTRRDLVAFAKQRGLHLDKPSPND